MPWRERFPLVDVEGVVSPDGAAAVLVAVSHNARLRVVGNRGHRTVANTLLGSTSMQLLHRAGCPVLIVRGTRAFSHAWQGDLRPLVVCPAGGRKEA
ncbi:universal stress protein [Actinoplanes sp. NPDC051494]|uniref:universal stress protein n=1 Tax=Actinoplanes sp. NPDC051494 TaxID=3363907 RepID=UPI0037AEDD6F